MSAAATVLMEYPTEEEMQREFERDLDRARWEAYYRDEEAREQIARMDSTQLEAFLIQEGYR